MSRITKIVSKSGVAAFALLAGVSLGAPQANAQACDPPGAAATAATGTIVPSIIQNALNVVTGIQTTMGLGSEISIPGVSGATCADVITCMQVFFTQHAQTVTNNQMMQSTVTAKAHDYQATNAYAIALQTEQSRQAVESGQGTSAQSNSLQYLNNPLCVPASVSTGAAQATIGTRTNTFTETVVQNSNGAANVSTAAPSSSEARQPQVSSVTSISNLYTAGTPYSTSGGAPMPSGPGNDTQSSFGLDTAAYRLLTPLAYPTGTNSGSLMAADNNYIRYILGVYPEVPPASASGASGQQATVAEREKVAFLTTAELGLKEEQALRTPMTNNGAANVSAIYNAVGQGTGPQGGMGTIVSKAQLLDALFRQPVENPNSFVSISSLSVPSKALQFIAGELLLSNYISYEHYLVQREMLDVNSAQLAIAYRDFNFQGHP